MVPGGLADAYRSNYGEIRSIETDMDLLLWIRRVGGMGCLQRGGGNGEFQGHYMVVRSISLVFGRLISNTEFLVSLISCNVSANITSHSDQLWNNLVNP